MRAGRSPQAAGALTAALYVEHGRMVLGLCRLLLRDPFDAEDAAQQAFVNAHQAILHGGRVRRPAQWLAAIARNECRARMLARVREPTSLTHEELVTVAGVDPGHDPDGVSTEVRAALRGLPARQREAVVLRDVYGLRHREVGAALGLSLPAVEALLFRARRRLRVRLRSSAGILVLPLALREGLAQALPGFANAAPAGGGAALGAGVLAHAGGGSLAVKLATGLAAVGTAGSVIALDTERPGTTSSVPRQTAVRPQLRVATRAAVPQQRRRAAESRRGRDTSNSGPGSGRSGDERAARPAERSGDNGSEGPGGGGGGDKSGEQGRSGSGPVPAPAPQTESAGASGPSESSGSGGSSATAGTTNSSGPGAAGSSSSGSSDSVSSSAVPSSSGSSGPGSVGSGPGSSGEPSASGSGSSGSSDSDGGSSGGVSSDDDH